MERLNLLKALSIAFILALGFFLPLGHKVTGQSSALNGCVAAMTAGTFARCSAAEVGLTADMIFPGPYAGGLGWASNGVWNSSTHVGYWWIGEHSSAAVCNGSFDTVACANNSQRFLKYDDASNTWSKVLDAATGDPNDHISAAPGSHAYQALVLDPATGDIYKNWYDAAYSWTKYDHTDSKWHKKANHRWTGVGSFLSAAWFPEANRAVYVNGQGPGPTTYGELRVYDPSADTWTLLSSLSPIRFGFYETVAIYNSVLHNMLVGGGTATITGTDDRRHFHILHYSSGTWSFESPADRTTPAYNLCGGANPFIFEDSGIISNTALDPSTGHYMTLTRDVSCNSVLMDYDSVADSWSTTAATVPSIVAIPTASSSWLCESTSVPEYGAIMYLCETSVSASPPAQVWLYKSGGSSSGSPRRRPALPILR